MKKQTVNIKPYTREFYRGNVPTFMLVLLTTLIDVLMSLGIAWLMQQTFDLIGGVGSSMTLSKLIIFSLALTLAMTTSYLISHYAKPRFKNLGIEQYKNRVFNEITSKSISAFNKESSSLYISALTNDISAIETGYLTNLPSLIFSIAIFIGTLALMIWYSPILTVIVICLSLLPVIASLLAGNQVAKAETRVSEMNESYTAALKESLSGFSVIKSFKAEKEACRIFSKSVERLKTAKCIRDKKIILVELFGSIAGLAAQVGIFLIGAYLAISGKGVTMGIVISFTQMMNYIINPIAVVPKFLAERKAARLLIEKIAVALKENVHDEMPPEHLSLKRGIEIKDLSFGYDPEKTILDNVSYSFELGKKYAIVGASGSGKSTLLNLLMASYPTYNGSIEFDGKELRKLNTSDLYETESIIQQSVFVFNASIRDNVTMFRDFPNDEVNEAIRLSGLSELIKEKGENYLCGENGCGLSGGEKQRISIARALLKRSQVLLVDEATAALDAETAYQVSSAILGLEGITAIVVTHSLDEALLKRYDEILTLKNGSIIEQGRFDKLIEKKGYFYSLFTVSQ